MIDFSKKYNREEVLNFLKTSFLKDYQKDIRRIQIPDGKFIKNAYSLGYSPELELAIFELEHEGSTEKRVSLTKEAFNVLRDSGNFKALAFFHSPDTDDWRFSLMTATPIVNEKGKVKTVFSNPKRFSFLLGPNAKVNTPTKFLITKGEIQNFEDLKERFSIEVVNKEFYKEISKLFIQLVGGTLRKGRSKEEYKALLRLPGVKDSSQTAQEFAVRLIGRLIFCWFLREKKNGSEESLMPHSLLSLEASKNHKNYYHDVLEPIFFKVLNVPLNSRKDEKFSSDPYDKIPYLNGGLFSPHDDDFYSTNDSKQQSNKEEVVVPDKWLQELFKILETYNFTIDENSAFDEELSIDPEMLGRIFENLLAEINPETGESARKSTGSYYTPRVIVDYMVDESLYLYLKNKTDIEEEKLRSLISYDLDDDTYTPLTEGEKEKIITAIDELKILDPACGSGAFPMGALQKIVFILQQLDPNGQYWFKAQIKNVPVELRKNLEREHSEKNFDYIRKLGVIRRNIFGVDIQPIATEISRLRCFLTLIVDQKVDDNKDNRGIDPLPNLDFKFVTANSLISLPEKENSKETIGMFEDTNRINELKDIRDQFFNASNFERLELKDQFRKIQLEMSKYYNSVKSAGAELTEMLLSWDPFSHKMTRWFDADWMFGVKDGFDIVIANPPYVEHKKLKKIRKLLTKYKAYSGTADLYVYFIEVGLNNLSKEGILTYITSNKFLKTEYGKNLRSLLSKYRVQQLIQFDRINVFDALVSTSILIVENSESKGELLFSDLREINNIEAFRDEVLDRQEVGKIVKDKWELMSPIDRNFLGILRNQTVIFAQCNGIEIRRGITTGFNEAFIIDTHARETMINKDSRSQEIIKPLIQGRNIRKWGYQYDNKYLLMTGYDLDIKNLYPVVYEHLLKYKGDLSSRSDQGKEWYNLRACSYYDSFEKEKIIWSLTSDRWAFAYDNRGNFLPSNGYILTSKEIPIKYLLGLMNSSLMEEWFQLEGIMTAGGAYTLKHGTIGKFPIMIPDSYDTFVDLVDSILDIVENLGTLSEVYTNTEIAKLEKKLDIKFRDLYGLT